MDANSRKEFEELTKSILENRQNCGFVTPLETSKQPSPEESAKLDCLRKEFDEKQRHAIEKEFDHKQKRALELDLADGQANVP